MQGEKRTSRQITKNKIKIENRQTEDRLRAQLQNQAKHGQASQKQIMTITQECTVG